MKKIHILLSVIIVAFIVSCEPDINDKFDPSAGNADFSKFVALGNSLTAGFTDGALYLDGQEYSFTNIMAYHFEFVGGGNYNIPLMPTNEGVGIQPTPQGIYLTTKYVLGYKEDCKGIVSLAPVLANPNASQQELQQYLFTSVAANGPFNNLGIPGLKSFHMISPGVGLLNPFMTRISANPAADVILNMALAQQPTFFSLWIGSNDVLTYAISGGTSDSITTQAMFAGSVQTILGNLTGSAKGVIFNIPDIVVIPFFTTVPYNAIAITNEADVNALNGAYFQLNQIIKSFGSTDTIAFKIGANPMVINDPATPWKIRQIKENELVLLSIPQDSMKCYGLGTQFPVGDNHVLTADEIDEIRTAINGYNQTIEEMAGQYNLALVDVYGELNYYNEHTVYIDGIPFNTDFITGNIFSLDGIHLCPRGNALVAFEAIESINKKFDARIPQVIISAYPGIEFP